MTEPDFLEERELERQARIEQHKARLKPVDAAQTPPRPRRAVSKRLITTHERRARAVEVDAQWIAEHWHEYEATFAATAPPALRAAGSRDGGRSSDHPDPVAGIALSHGDYTDLTEALAAWCTQGRWILDRMKATLIADGPRARETAEARRRNLCDRSVDPLCDEIADPDGGGKCSKCRKADYRRRRAENNGQPLSSQVVPSPVSVPAIVAPSASTATVWCHNCGADLPVPADVDPTVWLLDHRDGCTGAQVASA